MIDVDRMLNEVGARRDDLVQLTRDLLAIPTVNPPGRHYLDICQLLRTRLERSGFQVELLRAIDSPGDSMRHPRWNLVARREGAGPGPCVHFNGHTDVVAVGEDWTRDPFAGEVADGRVYGRGACDMKGGLATAIVAAETFADLVPGFRGAIEISATADEETGGFGGVAWLAKKGWFDPVRVQHVVIPEPLNKDRICLGHRGVWWAEIETKGRIAHGSMPFLGDCAVRHMGAVLSAFEADLYPLLATKSTEMPVVPAGARQSTMNINCIHGGEPEQDAEFDGFPAPCVPDRCRLILDRRFLFEESLDEVKNEVGDILARLRAERPGFDCSIRDLFEVLPVMTERDAPIVESVGDAIHRTLGRKPEFVVSPGTYDQKHIDRIGQMKNCIAYGPGILDLAHQPDEWIGIDDMVDSARVMSITLATLLADGFR